MSSWIFSCYCSLEKLLVCKDVPCVQCLCIWCVYLSFRLNSFSFEVNPCQFQVSWYLAQLISVYFSNNTFSEMSVTPAMHSSVCFRDICGALATKSLVICHPRSVPRTLPVMCLYPGSHWTAFCHYRWAVYILQSSASCITMVLNVSGIFNSEKLFWWSFMLPTSPYVLGF